VKFGAKRKKTSYGRITSAMQKIKDKSFSSNLFQFKALQSLEFLRLGQSCAFAGSGYFQPNLKPKRQMPIGPEKNCAALSQGEIQISQIVPNKVETAEERHSEGGERGPRHFASAFANQKLLCKNSLTLSRLVFLPKRAGSLCIQMI
jgi:hypothetical protein